MQIHKSSKILRLNEEEIKKFVEAILGVRKIPVEKLKKGAAAYEKAVAKGFLKSDV